METELEGPNASQPIKLFFISLKGEEQSIPSALASLCPSTIAYIITIYNTIHGRHHVYEITYSYMNKNQIISSKSSFYQIGNTNNFNV